MLARIQQEPYVNFLELSWIFIKREFFTTMEFLHFYDQEEREWNCRAVLWYVAAVCVMSAFLSVFAPILQSVMLSLMVTGAFTRVLQVSR